MGNDVRGIVLESLLEIIENNKHSHVVIGDVLKKYQYMEKVDRSFYTRLCEGTIEYMIQLDYIINQYSSVKVNKMKPVVRNILRMGVYQIKYMDNVPDSAACNEAVKLAQKKGFSNLKGFVNGVLRNIARNINDIKYPDREKEFPRYLSIEYSMPEWIILKFIKSYGKETAESILKSFLADKKTTICVNTCKISREQLKERLESQGIIVEYGQYSRQALYIRNYDHLTGIQEFRDGLFFVQDESSMCAVIAADIKEGETVIDVCAAPGGKTMYAAVILNNTGIISSRDISRYKTDMIDENISRCGFTNVETKIWDALKEDEEYISKADVVIADLPCSGIGVIGLKSDIKYKMTEKQMDELVELQRQMLLVVGKYVKKGGRLIYSTCTINNKENENNAIWFQDNSDLKLTSLKKEFDGIFKENTINDGYIQILPGNYDMNGFFISKFSKK